MQKLPIGIQTFSKIRDSNYLYIDKTKEALDLIEDFKYAFLSRPRRFGKSLFIDTLQELFEGNKKLFKNLYIYDKWNWQESYPVIKIDWAGSFISKEHTIKVIFHNLRNNQERLKIDCTDTDDYSSCFAELIKKSYEKYKKPVVILIDEYDKPILDMIDKPEIANENREILRSIYVMMKANDRYIKFAFLTGVTKFSKASIFSGLNNLEDISLNPNFGNICGYTGDDIETSFAPYLKNVDLEKLKFWYNGYNFLKDLVYNPFDILLFIKNGYVFDNYWFETGTPSFLVKLFKLGTYNLAEFENKEVGKELINSFDIENLSLETVMFQAGYLTIKEIIQKRNKIKYILTYPNFETKMSFNDYLLNYFIKTSHNKNRIQDSLIDLLEVANLNELETTLKTLFSSIAYNNFTNNDIAHYEGFYASLLYAYFVGAGFDRVIAEDVTNNGRIDMSVFIDEKVYIFEFKMTKEEAIKQIKEKKYYNKYQDKEVYLVGINFDEKERNICGFEHCRVDEIDPTEKNRNRV